MNARAKITDKPQLRRYIRHANAEYSGVLELSQTQCGEDFLFEMHGNHLRPFPLEVSVNGVSTPWYDALTKHEQALVFQQALAEYRLRSRGSDGWQMAALGVTQAGDIFVSENTESLSSPFYRQCAEQNMVTIATQREAYYEYRNRLASGEKNVVMEQAKLPKFRSFMLMGGQKPGAISCMCGNCTELINKVIAPRGTVYISPVVQPLEVSSDLPRLDENARALSMVRPGAIWQTDMKALNPHRDISLRQPPVSRKAYSFLCEQIAERMNLESAKAAEYVKLMHEKDSSYWKEPPPLPGRQPKYARNFTDKFPESHVNAHIQHYLKDAAYQLAVDLVKRMKIRPENIDGKTIEALMDEHLHAIRCVVVQTQSGNFHSAIEVRSTLHKSHPCAEILVLGGCNKDSVDDGIRNVRASELCPARLERGVMDTSPMDGVERLGKIRGVAAKGLQFAYYPFNGGTLEKYGLEYITARYSYQQLMPGGFAGSPKTTAIPSDFAHRGNGMLGK